MVSTPRMRTVLRSIFALNAVDQISETPRCSGRHVSPRRHRHYHLITNEREECRSPQATAFAQRSNGCPVAGRHYCLVPGPTLPTLEGLLLDELPAFFLPVAIPVVVPFFMFVCLVVLLVAPGPTFPSLDAPGAGCACANAPPVDSNRAHA